MFLLCRFDDLVEKQKAIAPVGDRSYLGQLSLEPNALESRKTEV
jgi:hypothetical protein